MPFVQGKCENCGGILTVDPSLKAANCPFCGIAYVVQDSINNYNTTINIESLHADVVNITNENASEGRLKAADAYMKLGKYNLAYEEYKKVSELAPQNHKGWLGLIESHTEKYIKRIISELEIKTLRDYSKSVILFAPNGTGEVLLKDFNEYIQSEENKNASEVDSIVQSITKQKDKLKKLNNQENDLRKAISLNGNEKFTITGIIEPLSNNRFKWLTIIGSIPTAIGVITCYFNIIGSKSISGINWGGIIVGIIFFILGCIVFTKELLDLSTLKKANRKIEELQSVQRDYEKQIDEIQKQKLSLQTAIQSNQSRIDKYN